jgi:hypothetical protein
MYNVDRHSKGYPEGVHYLLKVTKEIQAKRFYVLSMHDCKNEIEYSSVNADSTPMLVVKGFHA